MRLGNGLETLTAHMAGVFSARLKIDPGCAESFDTDLYIRNPPICTTSYSTNSPVIIPAILDHPHSTSMVSIQMRWHTPAIDTSLCTNHLHTEAAIHSERGRGMPLPVKANLGDYFPSTTCFPGSAAEHRLKRTRRGGCHPHSQNLQKTSQLESHVFHATGGMERTHTTPMIRGTATTRVTSDDLAAVGYDLVQICHEPLPRPIESATAT